MHMTRSTLLSRLHRLGPARRRLLLRSVLAVTAASLAVALLPFRRAILFGSVPLGPRTGHVPSECAWAIEAAARRLPWRALCIEQGLAAQRLLRRAGIDARLHYGARHEPGEANLEAHVWVTVDGRPVIGGDEAGDFAEIASYPSLHGGLREQ
jgi:hypothetical protein